MKIGRTNRVEARVTCFRVDGGAVWQRVVALNSEMETTVLCSAPRPGVYLVEVRWDGRKIAKIVALE